MKWMQPVLGALGVGTKRFCWVWVQGLRDVELWAGMCAGFCTGLVLD